jgi:hypothetical protein
MGEAGYCIREKKGDLRYVCPSAATQPEELWIGKGKGWRNERKKSEM